MLLCSAYSPLLAPPFSTALSLSAENHILEPAIVLMCVCVNAVVGDPNYAWTCTVQPSTIRRFCCSCMAWAKANAIQLRVNVWVPVAQLTTLKLPIILPQMRRAARGDDIRSNPIHLRCWTAANIRHILHICWPRNLRSKQKTVRQQQTSIFPLTFALAARFKPGLFNNICSRVQSYQSSYTEWTRIRFVRNKSAFLRISVSACAGPSRLCANV